MTRKVWTVKPDNSIVDAAEIMLHRRVSGLPVVDDEMHVVGVITESDIFRLLVESRKPAVASE